ncbi:hypothetical protein B6A10_15400 [Flavobacterium sp. L1I52]|uniref:Glycosyltransferase 2-like domain-containing protein n=1 Tax=Flavobacterium pokkalii TaxID=1940408 RepID=A0ABR7UWU8_9FLAO|nr:glycosyltransferase family A protein [Flavobacterium pokkalii]MBD0726558.1 hypothetical protein [Flavobacterium pokkalii]
MSIPKVSIIVPCYKQAHFLDEALQSVLEQTYIHWECIIVNDGSPDNTEAIAQNWLKKDSRFKYIYKENGGLSSARNAGIKIAKGDWILSLDADDKIGNEYLEKANEEFEKGCSVIYCNANFFGLVEEKWELPEYSYGKLLVNNLIFCSAFFRKKDWEKVEGYDENLLCGREDWEFWIAILNSESKVVKLDYIGFFYRRKENSMDAFLKNNKILLNQVENYIYKKHLNKYLLISDNAFENYQDYIKVKYQNVQILRNINKNYWSKLLYKILKML